MLSTATIAACTPPHDDPAMDAALIDYRDAMIAEPFKAFAFSPAGAAVYQLGPFGSAARLLKQFELGL